MALSEDSWNQVMRVISYKIAEMPPDQVAKAPEAARLFVMRENWELLKDHAACVAYLEEKDLEAKVAERDKHLAQANALDAEIDELT